jgi:two-component system, NtrC family, sensor histidine kinase HydH
VDLAYDAQDVRTRTTLVCGALALAIAVSALLRPGRRRSVHYLFAAFAMDIGFWYLSQSLFGLFQAAIWDRLRLALAVLLPVFAVNLFEAMVPSEEEDGKRSRAGKLSLIVAVPIMVLGLSTYIAFTIARVVIFLYAFIIVAVGLWEMGQRGLHSRSRATQKRVRFLVVTGALAGTFTVADFAWVIGYEPAYYPPPVGVVLSLVFLFMLAQALRHERLLDLYEMFGRLLVATALAFLIGFIFYLLVTVVGQFNTMWLNAIVAAIVVLVLFNPMREWVEKQMQRFVFREGGRLTAALERARRRLAHTLELEEMGTIVMSALEASRSVTTASLYVLLDDGTVYEELKSVGKGAPPRIEVATANALLEQLDEGPVVLEQVARAAREPREPHKRRVAPDAVLAAAEVLGELRERAVVVSVRGDEGERVGLLVVADERIRDAFSPEDIARLEALALQIGVVVENTRVYAKMKERDRLAVLGQMAAGLAHEIRNPLGAIKGAAQLLADPGADGVDPSSREFVGIILEEVDRLNAVVGSVLDLARDNTDSVPPIDVNAVVRRTLQVLSPDWSELALEVHTELDEELPRAAIAPEQLRQVLINLLQNAEQALKGQGTIRVTTRTRTRAQATWVTISVADDGPGIPNAALKKIFLPFFTTKEQGTGLGLAISQRIIQTVGGRIEVRSREGEGTWFDIILPAAAIGTPTPAPPVTTDPIPSS